MAPAGSIVIDLLMKTGAFETDTARAEAMAKKRADAIGKAFEDMGQKIALGASAAGAALVAMVVTTANTAKEISNLAQISGAGAAEFQRFAAAAKSVGVEQDQLGDIFKDFREKIGEFVSTGGGEMKDFFEQIAPKVGITADAFRNLSGPQALQLFYDSLQKAGLSTEQMSFYLESAANDATKLIPLLRDSGKELNALGDAAERMGIIMDERAIASAKEFSTNLATMQSLLNGVKIAISNEVIPAINSLSQEFLIGIKHAGSFGDALRLFGTINPFRDVGGNIKAITSEIESLTAARERYVRSGSDTSSIDTALAAERKRLDYLKEVQRMQALAGSAGDASDAISRRYMQPATAAGAPWTPPSTTKAPKPATSRAAKADKPAKIDEPFVGPLPDDATMKRYLELEREALSLKESLMTADEKRAAQQATWQEMLNNNLITQEQLNQLMVEPVEQGYWEQWLEAAEEAMTNFDELAGNVAKNFSTGFGNAFEKMVFDSQSLGDAMSNLAEGMARSVVNALGQMAAQWVASELVKRLASQATTTAVVAGSAAQAAAGVAANATAAASAAATGPAIAAAMAPAAVATSVATAGTNTFPAIAGLIAAMALIPMLAGARANGGPVSQGQTYLVGERGPELFTPNTSGAIVPNNKLGGGNVTVNLIEDKSRAGKTEERTNNGARELDVFVADIMGDGPRGKAIQRAFGLQRRGY